jgi:hypothetical protein
MEPVNFFWGADSIYKGKRNYWDVEQVGEIVMDSEFSISTPD